MKFEEQFPSLKNEITENPEEVYEEDNPMLECEIGLEKDSLQKHCLDKKKVLEVFDKIISKQQNTCKECEGYNCSYEEIEIDLGIKTIKKELRLEK